MRSRKPRVRPPVYPQFRATRAGSYEHRGHLYRTQPSVTVTIAPGCDLFFVLRDATTGEVGSQLFWDPQNGATRPAGFFGGFALAEWDRGRLAAILAPIGFRKPPCKVFADPEEAAPGHESDCEHDDVSRVEVPGGWQHLECDECRTRFPVAA